MDNLKKVYEWSNTPYIAVYRYIKSEKLYKNKFYFYFYSKNSKNNYYFSCKANNI